jgi:outer membrane protein assembly factor BamA
LPLYNLTGVAFVDAGMAWGESIPYTANFSDGTEVDYAFNSADLDFKVQDQNASYFDRSSGQVLAERPDDFETNRDNYDVLPAPQGDVLIGAGFGLRTIFLGFPLRYDVGWPYYRDGFDGSPIHYISIGIDF